jgi:hypothetical protein
MLDDIYGGRCGPIRKEPLSDQEEAAACLVAWLPGISQRLRFPKRYLRGGLLENDPGILAERAAIRVKDLDRELTQSLGEALRLKDGRLKSRVLATLYLARHQLQGDRIPEIANSIIKRDEYQRAIELCRSQVTSTGRLCGRRLAWLAAELAAWLASRGKTLPVPTILDLSPVQDAVYRALTVEYQSAVEIADAARVSETQARRELANLKRMKRADHKARIGYRRK